MRLLLVFLGTTTALLLCLASLHFLPLPRKYALPYCRQCPVFGGKTLLTLLPPGPSLPEMAPAEPFRISSRNEESNRYPSPFLFDSQGQPYYAPSQEVREVSRPAGGAHFSSPFFLQSYRIDPFSRRHSPAAKSATKHLLFLGCSYTFGTGVQDFETLPARTGEKLPSHRPYNAGKGGSSPSSLYLRSLDPNFFAGIPQKEGVAIYYFIADHVQRTLGSYTLVNLWGSSLPRLEHRDGKLAHAGTLGERMRENPAFPFWHLLDRLGIPWPLNYGEEDLALVARVLSGLRGQYLAKFPRGKFLVVLAPTMHEQKISYDLRPLLEREGIAFLDYQERKIRQFVAKPYISGDGHPSATYYAKVAEWLAQDLRANQLLE